MGFNVRYAPICLLLFGAQLLQTSMNSGTKMTIRTIFGGHPTDSTIYLQGDRSRTEFRNAGAQRMTDGSERWLEGPRLAMLIRCDLEQTFELNLDTAQYVATPYPPKPLTKEQIESFGLNKPRTSRAQKPTFRIETTTKDSGERKEMFGHIARHVITTRKEIPLAGGQRQPQETVTDGWYIDFDPHLSCDRRMPRGTHAHAFFSATMNNQPAEMPEFIDIGEPETGFALRVVMTTKATYALPDGTKKNTESKYETLVTQFEEGPLDSALFEVPAGFKRVEHIERNPALLPTSSPPNDFWERLKARVVGLLSP